MVGSGGYSSYICKLSLVTIKKTERKKKHTQELETHPYLEPHSSSSGVVVGGIPGAHCGTLDTLRRVVVLVVGAKVTKRQYSLSQFGPTLNKSCD